MAHSSDTKHPRVTKYKPYSNGGRDRNEDASWKDIEQEDLYDGMPTYDYDGYNYYHEQYGWRGVVEYFKYLLNIMFVVTPMALFEICFIAYNLYFNAIWNQMWANGNLYLMINTVYLIWQCFISLLLATEYPLFMRSMREFRFFSLLAAIYYNFIFAGVIFEWYRELYLESNKQYNNYDVVDVLVNMFLVYNVILHFPVVIVNCFIIFKEGSLEFWQFLKEDDGDPTNDMALGFWDLTNMMDDTLWYINPQTWINYFLGVAIDWGIEALIEWIEHGAFAKD